MKFIYVNVLIAALLLLTACATSQMPTTDPEFAAVRPIVSKALPNNYGAIYRTGHEVSFFEDSKARKVGDLITVVLQETTSSSIRASTSTKKESDVDTGLPNIFGALPSINGINVLQNGIEADRSFKGEGDSSQSNTMFGTITATVSEVYANGNLFVRGEKLLTLNQGVEHVRVSGIVRAQDVSPTNTIMSSQLANSKIIYGGEGVVAESNTKGWIQRLFDSNWWPF